jgi:hypothetical protein
MLTAFAKPTLLLNYLVTLGVNIAGLKALGA